MWLLCPSVGPKPREGLQRTEIDGDRCARHLHALSTPHYADNYFIHIMHHGKLLIWGLQHIWLVHRHSWHPVNTSLLDLSAS